MSESTTAEALNEEQDNVNKDDEVNEKLDKPKKIIVNSDLTETELMRILEAALFSAGQTLNIERLMDLFPYDKHPGKDALRSALTALQEQYMENTSLELKEVSSGFRFQVRKDYASWVAKLWEEKPARYSRALLETLSLVAYKQPISRGEIEKIRGVSVSTQIMKTLIEREWVHIVGHRDVPGKPAIYATTKEFLDYFNLTSLEELPPLAEIKDIDKINGELDLPEPAEGEAAKDLTQTDQAGEKAEQTTSESTSEEESATVVNLEAEEDSEVATSKKNPDEVDVAEAMTAEH